MTDFNLMLEAERRGLLPPEQQGMLAEARSRGLVSGDEGLAAQAAALDPTDVPIARSKNDALGNYLRAQASQPKSGETPEQTSQRQYGKLSTDGNVSKTEGVTRGYLQGGTFGAGDEIVAGGTAALDSLIRGEKFGDAYDARLGTERARQSRFRETDPALAYGSELVGAIPSSVAAPGMRVARGAGILERGLVGAANGGVQGGVYGFNAGEGGFADRLMNAGKSGAIGGGIGGIASAGAPLAGRAASNLTEYLLQGRAAKAAGIPRGAYDVLSETLAADGSLRGAGRANIRAAGPEGMLADAGPNAQALLDTAVSKSGPGSRIARTRIDQRATNASGQVTGALDDAFGVPGESSSRAVVVYGDKTNPLSLIYKRAHETPIDYSSNAGRTIEALVRDRVPASAIKAANELMRVEGQSSKQILADIADDGSVTFKQLPDVRQIDYITRGLNEVADRANGQGVMGGTTQTGRAYGNLSRELRNNLKEAVPAYRDALNSAAGLIREGKAKEFGSVVLSPKTTRDDVIEMVSDMGDAERRKIGEGLRMQVDEAMANVKRALTDTNMDAREAIKAVKDMSSRAAREKVEAIIGPEKAQQLFSQIDQATRAFELRAGVATNSKTFARTSMDDTIKELTQGGTWNALKEGKPAEAGKRLIQMLTGSGPDGRKKMSEETYKSIVNVLTGPRAGEAIKLLQNLDLQQSHIGPAAQGVQTFAERLLGVRRQP